MSGSEQNEQYNQGLLIWKLYIEAMEMQEEFKSADVDEQIDFGSLTAESVFLGFTDEIQTISQAVSPQKTPTTSVVEI